MKFYINNPTFALYEIYYNFWLLYIFWNSHKTNIIVIGIWNKNEHQIHKKVTKYIFHLTSFTIQIQIGKYILHSAKKFLNSKL